MHDSGLRSGLQPVDTKESRSSQHHCMQLADHRWCSPALLSPPHLVHSSAVSGTPAGPPNTVFSRFSASAGGRLSASSPAAVLTCGAAAAAAGRGHGCGARSASRARTCGSNSQQLRKDRCYQPAAES